MKITFILPGTDVSGGIRSTLELANRLQGKSHDVSVVYPWISGHRPGARWYDLREVINRAGRTISNFRKGNRIDWFDLKTNLVRVPTLSERFIPKGDIIVATWWGNTYRVNRYGNDKGEKFYIIRHYEVWAGPENLVNKTYIFPFHKIVTSMYLKNVIEKKFNVTTLGPLSNGVNFDLFYRESEGFESHTPKRIGILYRKEKWKGIEDGLKAFLMAKKRHTDIKLVLFGEDIAQEDKDIIKDMKDVEFHKLPFGKDLRKIYNSLDIFVFPSHCEGFGNPPMEAMACGAACVTTNAGAVPDYTIPGETALVSSPKDIEALAKNIIELLDDEDKREKIAKNGYDHIKKFTWDRTTDQLEEIFERAIER